MDRIRLLNDELEFVRDNEDFIQLVNQYMGRDAVEYIENWIEDVSYVNPDIDYYEQELENNQATFEDLYVKLLDLAMEFTQPRLNRKKLADKITKIKDLVDSQRK